MRALRAAALALACSLDALAAPGPALSDYEKESIRLALDDVGGRIDPSPEGKWIEGVDVVTLDAIEARDPAPDLLDAFHVTTRHHIVEREVLLHVGDRYDAELVEESERNLRVPQLSVVLIVPTVGSAPDRVRLLVVTKDVFSLRVNSEPVFVNARLRALYLQPSEANLFGLHKTLSGTVILDRATYSLGLGFADPRILGSRLQAAASVYLVFNCRTDDVEGSFGRFSYGQPLYSARTKWSWGVSVGWRQDLARPAGTIGQSVCADGRSVPIDFRSTPRIEAVPYQFREDVLGGQFAVLRSFGESAKQDVSFGLEASRFAFSVPDLSAETPEVRRQFADLVPSGDQRMSPFAQIHAYENRFHRVLDFETLGLQEDYRLGYDFWLRGYPAARAVGSSRDLFGTYAALGYTVPLGDGLGRAYAGSTLELARGPGTDAQVEAGLRLVSPRLPLGRFVLDGVVVNRFVNYLNSLSSLGATGRLRGYPLALVGPNVVVSNLELRSRPVEILSVQVGAAAFYDVGDAFVRTDEMRLHHGVGGGLRFLIPQLDRSVFRMDVGVPIGPYAADGQTTFVAQFYQAFSMPGLGPRSVVP